MSMFEKIEVVDLRLISLETVVERLGLDNSSVQSEHLFSGERVTSLGKSISRNFKKFINSVKKLEDIKSAKIQKSLDSLGKVISLQEALSEAHQSLLKKLVEQSLSMEHINSLQIIENAKSLLEKGEIINLSEKEDELEKALNKLTEITKKAHQKLVQVEKEVLSEKTLDSLTTLGYHVQLKNKKDGILLRAYKKDLSIAAQITNEGTLSIDLAGFEGESCKEEIKKINNELIKRGIGIRIKEIHNHGKKSGGTLTREVEREIPAISGPSKKLNKVNIKQKMSLYMNRIKIK